MKVNETLQWIADKMCNEYCRWPAEYKKKYRNADEAEEHLMEEKCGDCPLNEI